MAVGKGSIQRVKVATNAATEEIKKQETAEVKTVTKAAAADEAAAKKAAAPKKGTAAKKAATPKKTAAPKTAAKTKAASVKKDDIHEKKFEMIDGIYTELPTYLL